MGSATTQEDRHKTNVDCCFSHIMEYLAFAVEIALAAARKDSSNVQRHETLISILSFGWKN